MDDKHRDELLMFVSATATPEAWAEYASASPLPSEAWDAWRSLVAVAAQQEPQQPGRLTALAGVVGAVLASDEKAFEVFEKMLREKSPPQFASKLRAAMLKG